MKSRISARAEFEDVIETGWESLSLFMGAIRQEVRKLLPDRRNQSSD